MTAWTILCPGKSLSDATWEDVQDWPEFPMLTDPRIVAVNAAIGHPFCEAARYLFWACFDEPTSLAHLPHLAHVQELQPILWCAKKHLEEWLKWGIPVHPVPLNPRRVEALIPPIPFVEEAVRRGSKELGAVEALRERVLWQSGERQWWPGEWLQYRTIFMAIALCIVRGAKRIRIYGCDMEGTASYHGGTGEIVAPKSQNAIWWCLRWEAERRLMAMCVADCAEHGVEVEVVGRGAAVEV